MFEKLKIRLYEKSMTPLEPDFCPDGPPALGPSGLLDFALRALRSCDPRNDALDSESGTTHVLYHKSHSQIWFYKFLLNIVNKRLKNQ